MTESSSITTDAGQHDEDVLTTALVTICGICPTESVSEREGAGLYLQARSIARAALNRAGVRV